MGGLTVCSLVSLQQMALFGQNPSQGTLLRASQFLLGAYPTSLVAFVDLADHPLNGFFRRGTSSTSGSPGKGT
jgi:hypothetical protein